LHVVLVALMVPYEAAETLAGMTSVSAMTTAVDSKTSRFFKSFLLRRSGSLGAVGKRRAHPRSAIRFRQATNSRVRR
jgi:hypothetical protein